MTAEPFGPIRPEDAVDGWKLEGDPAEWWLTKELPNGVTARIKGTTAKCCAWTVAWREASEYSVAEARERADRFIVSADGRDVLSIERNHPRAYRRR
ncbi:hypothetical protein [Nocardia sp. NBC_00511]|uniref:hypothetical protein n=1 Tax=Nocardia sp. NBC_00511 TaxID=2903591 RepID=UPI0030E347AA